MLLPLFPLNVVLFPGTRAPLHVFEDRYRAMLADVLAGDGQFGVIGPEGVNPDPGMIGVVARILTHQPLDDGRSNILVEGTTRFMLQESSSDRHPYFLGQVVEFDDEPNPTAVDADLWRRLRDLADRCRKAMVTLADAPVESGWSADLARFTFQIAAAIPWDPEQARPLLAMRSAAERAAMLLQVLPGVVPDLERRAVIHRRAGTNGKGQHQGTIS